MQRISLSLGLLHAPSLVTHSLKVPIYAWTNHLVGSIPRAMSSLMKPTSHSMALNHLLPHLNNPKLHLIHLPQPCPLVNSFSLRHTRPRAWILTATQCHRQLQSNMFLLHHHQPQCLPHLQRLHHTVIPHRCPHLYSPLKLFLNNKYHPYNLRTNISCVKEAKITSPNQSRNSLFSPQNQNPKFPKP